MRLNHSSVASVRRRLTPRGRRRGRPRFAFEYLETRLALALHIENFSDDLDATHPGFDSWDADPWTIPGGDTDADSKTTLGPDEFLIPHQTSSGQVFFLFREDPSVASFALGISGVGDWYETNFAANRDLPGGLGQDEVAAVGIEFFGAGTILFVGDNGVKTVTARNWSSWDRVTVTSNDPSDSGAEMGPIERVLVTVDATSIPRGMVVDDIAVLVLDSGFSNNPPNATNDFKSTLPGKPVDVDFMANDGDLDGDPISYVTLRRLPSSGHVMVTTHPVSGRPIATYTPAAGFHGVDSFEYEITDSRGTPFGVASGTVQILVNTPPPALHKFYAVPHNHFGEYTNDGLLEDKLDIDGDMLTVRLVRPPTRGTVTVIANGSFTYSPNSSDGRLLSDSFDFVVSDGFEESEPKTAVLQVPNEPPVAGGSIDVAHGAATPLLWSFPYFDADGDTVTVELVRQSNHGFIRSLVVADGRVHVDYWTESGRAIQNDSFTYRLFDGYDRTEPITVEIRVPNQRPQIVFPPSGVAPNYWAGNFQFIPPGGNRPASGLLFNQGPIPDADTEPHFTFVHIVPPGSEQKLSLAIDDDGDPLSPVLARPARYGTVSFSPIVPQGASEDWPSYQWHYTPRPPVLEVVGDSLAGVVQEMYAEFPSRTVAIREAALRLEVLVPDEFATTDEFLDAAETLLLATPNIDEIKLTDSELQSFRAKLPTATRRKLFFGADTFPYRVTDGALESSDEIFVRLDQSLGSPVARSDVLFWEGDPDNFGILPSPPYSGWAEFQLDAAGILKFDPSVLLQNDFFTNGIPANFFSELSPDLELLTTARAYELYDGFGHRYRESQNGAVGVIPLDQPLYIVPNFTALDAGFLDAFDYRFTYTHPGVPGLHASSVATVRLVVTLDDPRDPDGVPDDIEAGVPSRSSESGDGDGNGIADYLEAHVASIPNAVDGRYVTIVAEPGVSLVAVQARNAAEESVDEGIDFPIGWFAFRLVGLPPGGSTTVTMLPPFQSVPADHIYYKNNVRVDSDGDRTERSEPFPYLPESNTGAELLDDNADGYVDRIVLHLKDSGRGDYVEFSNDAQGLGEINDPGGPGIRRSGPRIESVVINDGHAQRSKINNITVTFDSLVTIEQGAFELRRQGTNTPIGLVVALREENSRTVAVLTFSGHGIIGGSLFDGRYTLLIHGDNIRGAAGQSLDGDGDGVAGGNRRDEFFRRFGDGDGDGDVDAIDRRNFVSTLGRRAGDPDYLWYFDFNDDGRVALIDLLAITIASLGPHR